MNMIRHSLFSERYATEMLGLIIAPTSDCNFDCPYCYEKDVLRNHRMTEDVAQRILELVSSRIQTISHLYVTWYGGEPLLEKERLYTLSDALIKLCDENNVQYSANIITNGYLLSQATFARLMTCRVNMIQITLDGIAKTHDARRYLRNKQGTFDAIMENLLQLNAYWEQNPRFPSINIRINVDKNNFREPFDLLDHMMTTPLKHYVVPYLGCVSLADDKSHMHTLSHEAFNALSTEFAEKMRAYGFSETLSNLYPYRKTTQCACDRQNSYVIASDGSLYKCWEEIGQQSAQIGSLLEEEAKNASAFYYQYMVFDPTMDETCAKCKILPHCMGGVCPMRRRQGYERDCHTLTQEFWDRLKRSASMMGCNVVAETTL